MKLGNKGGEDKDLKKKKTEQWHYTLTLNKYSDILTCSRDFSGKNTKKKIVLNTVKCIIS